MADSGVDLYVLAADGSDIQQLTSADGRCAVAWSPDGSAVIYDTLVDGVPQRVMTIPAAGGTATPIASPAATFTGCDADARPPPRPARSPRPWRTRLRPVGRTA